MPIFILIVVVILIVLLPYILPFVLIYYIGRPFYKNPDKLKDISNSIRNVFNSKKCDICNGRIVLNNSFKLKNGNICKDCSASLSPWFSNYSNTSINEIKEQLYHRKENQKKVKKFTSTRALGWVSNRGKDIVVMVDDDSKRFLIDTDYNGNIKVDGYDIINGNPDIIDFSDVESCSLKIEEEEDFVTEVSEEDLDYAYKELSDPLISDDDKTYYEEIIESTKPYVYRNGARVRNSYYGRTRFSRRKIYYDFYIVMKLNHHYLDEIKFKLNFYKVYANDDKYQKYVDEGKEICLTLS